MGEAYTRWQGKLYTVKSRGLRRMVPEGRERESERGMERGMERGWG